MSYCEKFCWTSTMKHLERHCHSSDTGVVLIIILIVRCYPLSSDACCVRRCSFQVGRMVDLELELRPFHAHVIPCSHHHALCYVCQDLFMRSVEK